MNRGPILAAFGIPTVDFNVLVPDGGIVARFGLREDAQREMDGEDMIALKNHFVREQYESKYLAGGNCQVSLMIFQKLVERPFQTVMFGAVGDDAEAAFLEDYLKESKVISRYDKLSGEKTALSIIAVKDQVRTIAAANGAGAAYSLRHVGDFEKKLELLKRTQVALFEGFFLGFSYDISFAMINNCRMNGNVVVANISGIYIVENHHEKVISCVKMCDILIGNKGEFCALCHALGLPDDNVVNSVRAVRKLMRANKSLATPKLPSMRLWGKIVIVTDNKNPVLCAFGKNDLITVPVPWVDPATVKDTTGAGDSFLSGFLYGLVEGYPVKECLEFGCRVATAIITQHGYHISDQMLNSIKGQMVTTQS